MNKKGGKMEAVVNCAAYSQGRRVANIGINDVNQALKQPDKFVWIGLHEPGEEVLKEVQQEFELHDLAIEDAHRAHQRPKFEAYGDILFIVLRTAQRNYLQHRVDFGHLLGKGPGFALYAVMDSIVDQYFPVIDALEEELENLEEKIFAEQSRRETTIEIYELKRELMEVKRAVSPLIEICNRLMRFDLKVIPEDTRPYFRDIYDHVIRINEMVDNARELLSTALDANFSLISISQNEVSKRFAGWAAIVGVPTMIAGIYGMNFKFMPELNWSYGYPVILALTLGSCVLLYLLFKRSGWL